MTVPALLATGAGKVVKKMREREGEVRFFVISSSYKGPIKLNLFPSALICNESTSLCYTYFPGWQALQHLGEKLETSCGGVCLSKGGEKGRWRGG